MADVAAAMGLAKGTLYPYVESKEALFDLVVRNADRDELPELPPKLPVPVPKPGATLEFVARARRAARISRAARCAHAPPDGQRAPGARGNLARALRDARTQPQGAEAHRPIRPRPPRPRGPPESARRRTRRTPAALSTSEAAASLRFRHLVWAAFLAISARRFLDRAFARARPPFAPPSFPSATAAGFFSGSASVRGKGSGSAVARSTTARARLGSVGSLLERLGMSEP
jgi:AcrR family transcriptional regulator